jgi:hypothetical protein
VDLVTKREIIRGLVKRVEIHKDEILVVFRIDPDPGFNASESSTGSDIEEKSMLDRTRRYIAVAGEYLSSLRAWIYGQGSGASGMPVASRGSVAYPGSHGILELPRGAGKPDTSWWLSSGGMPSMAASPQTSQPA